MESVIAEKLEARVHLGMLNSRMKDFFDVWFLARTFSFDGAALADAIRATFERRGTTLEAEGLDALIGELSTDASKHTQWRAFLNKGKLVAPPNFPDVAGEILEFASFPLRTNPTERRETASWSPGGRWVGGGEERSKMK